MVLGHVNPDGSESPIAYHSKTFNKTERKYSELDGAVLSIVLGVKKFHNYVYGRNVEIVTDPKPLMGLSEDLAQLVRVLKHWFDLQGSTAVAVKAASTTKPV